MRKLLLLVVISGVPVLNATERYGRGLQGEYKSPYIPHSQQSGWNYSVDDEKKAAPQTTTQQARWVLEGVQFETGSDKILPESQETLDEAAAKLNNNKRAVVEIQGYTDNVGDSAVNQDLSQRRAAAVKNYLVNKGVEANRLEAKGYGQDDPIADNSSSTGRAQNRRIEFKVLKR